VRGRAALPSLTPAGATPDPWDNLFQPDRDTVTANGDAVAAQALIDQNSGTSGSLHGVIPTVDVHFVNGPQRVLMYTLTSAATAGADPHAWALQGSSDGSHWHVLDRWAGESFRWRQQLRAFSVTAPDDCARYRWRVDNGDGTRGVVLAEIEWLGHPAEMPAQTPSRAH
jgi:hypothetical protein